VASSGVSVVIPAYNAERFLSATVASVFAQTVLPDEVIVVDDGSTDGTPALLRSLRENYPLRVITRENGRQARARNDGVAASRGELVALLDHDDLWHPTKLERQLDQLAADPSLGMCFTAVNLVRGDTREVARQESWDPDPAAVLQRFLTGCAVATPSSVIARREVLPQPMFAEMKPYGADWLLWLEMAAAGVRIGYLPEPLVDYLQHETSLRHAASYYEVGANVMDRFFREHTEVPGGRYWRALWHLRAAERGDGRRHLLKAALAHPRSVRPGWVRVAFMTSGAGAI
jgi:glycosyltransferase involved in cell wall biosynthesis